MKITENDALWVLVCGSRLGPIHPFHFPALMSLHRITPDIRGGEKNVYIADPKHLAEVVEMVAATRDAAAYARGLEDAAVAAHNAIHEAIEEAVECLRVKVAVDVAIHKLGEDA